jgi:hypothetical protein
MKTFHVVTGPGTQMRLKIAADRYIFDRDYVHFVKDGEPGFIASIWQPSHVTMENSDEHDTATTSS